jgi:uncharacterized membrane protein
MAWFYFDFREDGTFVRDDTGVEFPSVDAVATEAAALAMAVAHERLTDAKMQTVIVEARDEQGATVLSATVSLKLEVCQGSKYH